MTIIAAELPHLDKAINKALCQEIANGRTPEQIRHFIMKRTQRDALAKRCEQAARYLQGQE